MEVALQGWEVPNSSAIICEPNVEQFFEFSFQIADHGKDGEAVEDHGQGVALDDSFHAVEKEAVTRAGVHNEESPVAIAIEHKVETHGPFMANSPEHHHSFGHLKGIGAIVEKDSKIRFVSHLFPGLGDSMDGAFNASFEATAELIGATGLGGQVASCVDNNFGHEAAPDLTDANGANTRVFVKGDEAVRHEGADGGPGPDGVGEPLSEPGNGGAKGGACGFVADEPLFEGGAIRAAQAGGAFEVCRHVSHNVLGH